MTKKKLFYGYFIVFIVITLLGSDLYRPYIWSNHINDFGLADSCTNISGVLTATFLVLGNRNYSEKKEERQSIIALTISLIVYEFIQILLPMGTFDWNDIVASVIGGVLTWGLYEMSTLFILNRLNEV